MDLRDGNKADGTTVQTWQCGNNINQVRGPPHAPLCCSARAHAALRVHLLTTPYPPCPTPGLDRPRHLNVLALPLPSPFAPSNPFPSPLPPELLHPRPLRPSPLAPALLFAPGPSPSLSLPSRPRFAHSSLPNTPRTLLRSPLTLYPARFFACGLGTVSIAPSLPLLCIWRACAARRSEPRERRGVIERLGGRSERRRARLALANENGDGSLAKGGDGQASAGGETASGSRAAWSDRPGAKRTDGRTNGWSAKEGGGDAQGWRRRAARAQSCWLDLICKRSRGQYTASRVSPERRPSRCDRAGGGGGGGGRERNDAPSCPSCRSSRSPSRTRAAPARP